MKVLLSNGDHADFSRGVLFGLDPIEGLLDILGFGVISVEVWLAKMISLCEWDEWGGG